MRSLLGRFHRPFARSVDEQLLSLNNLGDGSTLSLDFTTGVLDPRLTFTRSTNATFINSSGLVEWANANMYWNTAFEGLSGTNPTLGGGTGWSYAFSGSSGNAVFNGDGTVTVTTTGSTVNDRRAIQRSSGFSGAGLRIVFSVDVLISSGTLQPGDVLWTGAPNNYAFYVNGSLYTSGSLPVGTAFNLSLALDSNSSGTSNAFFGIGCSGGIAGSATFSNPRWTMWKGSGTVPYYPNTSATNNSTANYFKSNDYQAPRFDHDPTTLAPRGLLIEGAATNLSLNSEDFSAWSTANTSLASESGDTNPNGITVPTRVSDNSTNGEHYLARTPSLTTATTYTKSAWFKNPATNGRRYGGLQLFAGGGTDSGGVVAVWDFDTGQSVPSLTFGYGGKPTPSVSCVPYKSGWYRVSISMTVTGTLTALNHRILLSNGTATSYANSGTALGLLVWGAQLETGSGASSYIPTVASQGSRAADECSMNTTNFAIGSWYTAAQGTFYTDVQFTALSGNQSGIQLADNSGGSETNRLSIRRNIAIATRSSVTARQFTPTATGRAKSAFAYGTADYRFSQNGATFSSIAGDNGAPPNNIDRMTMFAPGAIQIYGWIRAIKFWPTSLSQDQLNSYTTL